MVIFPRALYLSTFGKPAASSIIRRMEKRLPHSTRTISALSEGGGIHTYTAVEGDTVQSVIDTTGVNFDSLAQMNPDLLSLDQEIPEGTVITTGASSAELIKVKVVRRDCLLYTSDAADD